MKLMLFEIDVREKKKFLNMKKKKRKASRRLADP